MKRVFFASLALTLALMVALGIQGAPLRTPAAPSGIVSFELAFTAARAQAMLSSWGPSGQAVARANLWLDYAFLLAYPVTILTALRLWAARLSARPRVARAYRWLAGVQPLAGALDAVENACLLHLLDGAGESAARAAGAAASVKFLIVGAGIAAAAVGLWIERAPPRPDRG